MFSAMKLRKQLDMMSVLLFRDAKVKITQVYLKMLWGLKIMSASIYDLGLEAEAMGMHEDIYRNQRILFMTQSILMHYGCMKGLNQLIYRNKKSFSKKRQRQVYKTPT